MSNRLLINITIAVEWLKSGDEMKDFYEDVIIFLEKAINILQPAVEDLRGKDIHQTEKVRIPINITLFVTNSHVLEHAPSIRALSSSEKHVLAI